MFYLIYNQCLIYKLIIKWKKTKGHIDKHESFFTTNSHKSLMVDVFLMLLQPYWFLNDVTFTDAYNFDTEDTKF